MLRRLPSSLLLYLMLTPALFAQTPTLGLNAPQLYNKGMSSLMGVWRQRQRFERRGPSSPLG